MGEVYKAPKAKCPCHNGIDSVRPPNPWWLQSLINKPHNPYINNDENLTDIILCHWHSEVWSFVSEESILESHLIADDMEAFFSPLLFIETDLVIHNAFCQSKFPVVHKSTCWLASNRALTLHLKLPTPSRLINQNTGQFNLVPLSSLLYPSFVLSLYLDSFIMTIWNHMEIDMKNYITNFILWIQCLIWHFSFFFTMISTFATKQEVFH